MTYAAMCLALCLVLPFLTGQIPQIGNALSPMHIPVFLCGFLCGFPYGICVGFIAPLLRFALFGMPPIFPTGLAMCFELAVYGGLSGLLYRVFPRKPVFTYATLCIAMIGGRLVWGLARYVMASVSKGVFTFDMFLLGAFVNAVPGIICHLLLIPAVVIALNKARLIPDKPRPKIDSARTKLVFPEA